MQAPKVTQGAAQDPGAKGYQQQLGYQQRAYKEQLYSTKPSAPVNRTNAGQLAPEVRVVVLREQAPQPQPQQPQQQPQQPTGNQRTASAAMLGAIVGAGVAGGLLLAKLFS